MCAACGLVLTAQWENHVRSHKVPVNAASKRIVNEFLSKLDADARPMPDDQTPIQGIFVAHGHVCSCGVVRCTNAGRRKHVHVGDEGPVVWTPCMAQRSSAWDPYVVVRLPTATTVDQVHPLRLAEIVSRLETVQDEIRRLPKRPHDRHGQPQVAGRDEDDENAADDDRNAAADGDDNTDDTLFEQTDEDAFVLYCGWADTINESRTKEQIEQLLGLDVDNDDPKARAVYDMISENVALVRANAFKRYGIFFLILFNKME